MSFRIGALGPLYVHDDGRELVLAAGKQRVLLVCLAVSANRAVSVDELVDAVWDRHPPAAAEPTLRNYVRRLRQALGPTASARLETRHGGYLLALDEEELDLTLFESRCRHAFGLGSGDWVSVRAAAESALELWRGRPLDGIESHALREQCVPRLEQLHAQALEIRIEADLRLAPGIGLITELRELIRQHPLREQLHGQLMAALTLTGRQTEALTVYQRAREIIGTELGVEPGPWLRHLHERILAGDADLLGDGQARARTVDAAPGVPRQLPAMTAHFVGRAAELDRLCAVPVDAPVAGTVVISAIDGMAGIGKTALAVQAAHRLAARFPDGQLFLDLHGHVEGREPRDAGDALDLLIASLGTAPQRIPADLDARAALYRQLLAGTRTLIVLDDAVDEAQVRPLLPGTAECLVLITSRRRLRALDEADPIALDVLSRQAAAELFRRIAGPERIPVDDPLLAEIIELCGRLPLALRIAAALLRHRPASSLQNLVERLRDKGSGVSRFADTGRDLDTVFRLSFHGLPDRLRRVFHRVGFNPGPDLDAYAAAALLDVDPETAEESLRALVDHNLLVESVGGRYGMHDLLRRFARSLVDQAPDAALTELMHYYQHTAVRASALVGRQPQHGPRCPAPAYAPSFADDQQALVWLRTERPDIEACLEHAIEAGWHDQVVGLATGLAVLLRADGHWRRARVVHEAAVDAAGRAADQLGRARALDDLGRILLQTWDHTAAVDVIGESLTLLERLDDPLSQANALIDLGRVRYLTGDYQDAAKAIGKATELFERLGNRLGLATAFADLSRVYSMTGNYPGAAEAASQALNFFRELGRRNGQASALIDLGRALLMIGDHVRATEAITESLDLFRELHLPNGEAGALTEQGRAYLAGGRDDDAVAVLTEAARQYGELGNPGGQGGAQVHLGLARLAVGDTAGAIDALATALRTFRTIGSRGNEAWALTHYARALVVAGDVAQARSLFDEALPLSRELQQPDDEARAMEGIGDCLLRTGATDDGVEWLRQALDGYRRLGMQPEIASVAEQLARLTPR